MDIDIELTQPITSNGNEIDVLKLRDLTGADCFKNGFIFLFTEDMDMKMDHKSLKRHIIDLAGVTKKAADQIAPKDLLEIYNELIPFFLD